MSGSLDATREPARLVEQSAPPRRAAPASIAMQRLHASAHRTGRGRARACRAAAASSASAWRGARPLLDRPDVAARHAGEVDEVAAASTRPARLEEVAARLAGAPSTAGTLSTAKAASQYPAYSSPSSAAGRSSGGVGDRPRVQLERLVPAGDGARRPRARDAPRGRPGARSPARSKWTDAWISEAPDQRPELAGAGMQATQLARLDGAVQRVAQELVAEVEEALVEEVERIQEGLSTSSSTARRGRRPGGP